MTTDEIASYYSKLLILQYRQQPKALAMVVALIKPLIMDQMPLAVQNAFDVKTAVGVQLDVLGKYVGVNRSGFTFQGPIVLTDSQFSVLIQLAILTNNADPSLATIQDLIAMYFSGQMLVFDYKNMRLSYYLDHTIGNQDLAEMIVTQHLLPKPMGVQISSIIYAPDLTKFFIFRNYQGAAVNGTPFNTYSVYNMNSPWLSYTDALIV